MKKIKLLKNKKILITAGPVWVPIDKLRIITNIFSGRLGFLIAQTAYQNGADVTLLLGPGRIYPDDLKSKNKFNILRFRYYEELLELVKNEVKTKKYDVVIKSAAVADYIPIKYYDKKIKSGKKKLIIKMKPTLKIIDLIKKMDPSVFLVKFKLETNLSEKKLIDTAHKSMNVSDADLIVANNFESVIQNEMEHTAFIIDKNKNIKKVIGKKKIAIELIKLIAKKINQDEQRKN